MYASKLLDEWVSIGFRPSNLNIFFIICPMVDELLKKWQQWNSEIPTNHNAWLKIYSRFKIPLNLSLIQPVFQLQFGQAAVLPLLQVTRCGTPGMDYCDGTIYTGTNIIHVPKSRTIDSTSTEFVTKFSFTHQKSFLPSHLEEIAIACPNLQQIILRGSHQCLVRLEGLRAIASHCHNLKGLDISGISMLESQIQLWEILSGMKLTHLAVDFCVISTPSGDEVSKKNLKLLVEKCSSLQALGYCYRSDNCTKVSVENCSLLSHFPSLLYCNVGKLTRYSISIEDIIASCKKIKNFRLLAPPLMDCPPLTLSIIAHNVSLQQLCIDSAATVIPDAFMSSVSAHGGLVHVFLSVASVSVVGISVLIEYSPELMTFQSILELCDMHNVKLPTVEFSQYEVVLKQKFHHRKIFHRGGYHMLQRSVNQNDALFLDDIFFLEQTDVSGLWDDISLL